jgi:hypothetical protein
MSAFDHVEVMWLTGRLIPDHKTIADFRKDSGQAIKRKFKAVNTRDKNFTRGKVERRRAQLEKSVARYLAQLDTCHQSPRSPSSEDPSAGTVRQIAGPTCRSRPKS